MSNTTSRGRVIGWIDYRLPIFTFLQHELAIIPRWCSSKGIAGPAARAD
jgi:hypothetical protein